MPERLLGCAREESKGKWAIQEANTTGVSTENQHIPSTGAEKGAENRAGSFVAAVAAVMSLPLSDSEKAEAVRRLLAG
jgi:hypothetical protein